jgi:DNA topoisomerase-1
MQSENQLEGYCLKCKQKRILSEPVAEWASNGTPATRGRCPVCGTVIYRRGQTPLHEKLPKPEPQPAGRTRPASKAGVAKTASKKSPAKRATTAKGKSASSATAKKNGNGRPAFTGRRSGKLVVVESPAKAKTIGRYLGRGFHVKSSVGHVRDLLKSRLSVDIENHFAPEYRVMDDKRHTVRDLADAAARAEQIYLATDPDREGEAIAWHVMEAAEMDPARTQRVVFHEITESAIHEAFAQPRAIDMDRVDAQQARRILDRLVGYKLSPLLWNKVTRGLSAGRVQSVAVRLVVEREREVVNFVPVEYWTLEADLSQWKYRRQEPRPFFRAKLAQFQGKEPVLATEADVLPHLDALERASWTLGDVKLGKRSRRPAAPFTTSTLQQEASRRLGFPPSRTMRVAQQLYEGVEVGNEGSVGLITYMRTDSMNVSKEAQQQARDYITRRFGRDYAPHSAPHYKTKSKSAQEAHEAVRPTSVPRLPERLKGDLSRDQLRLYSLIWERFVASQMAPALYDTVNADIWAGDAALQPVKRPYLFRAAGSTLRFPGFLALYEESEPNDRPEDGENRVPSDLEPGEPLDMLLLVPEQHFTQPPPRFTEATLVKALEENGIGRPSTYASIISTVLDRGYMELVEKRLRPTEIGELVNDLLVEHFPEVMSVDFTAQLEDELDEIAGGKPWVPVIERFYDRFSSRLEAATAAIPNYGIKSQPEPVGRECPLCGKPLVYRESRFGRFVGCSDFPRCRHTEQLLVKIGVACPKDGGELIEKKTRKGRKFYGCANYPECDWTSWQRPIARPCAKCGGLLVLAGNGAAQCTQCGARQSAKAESGRQPASATH